MKRKPFSRAGLPITSHLVAAQVRTNRYLNDIEWIREQGFSFDNICPVCFKKHKTFEKMEKCIKSKIPKE